MLPANLAKTRAAGRGTYGELLVLSGTPTTSLGSVGGHAQSTATLRYAPYPLPASLTNHQAAHQHHQPSATTHILPLSAGTAPSIIQYATTSQPLYDAAVSYKRLLAATAAASFRPHPHQQHHPSRATATLTYPLGDLLNIQGLDVSALYPIPTATLGL